jgi:hypothetical protein
MLFGNVKADISFVGWAKRSVPTKQPSSTFHKTVVVNQRV